MAERNIAKTQRSKRAMDKSAPKLVENCKQMLALKGPNTSDVITTALKDLYILKKPDAKMFTKRNITRPFEDQSSVEFLCKVNDSSLFAFGSHTKKRPQNMTLGRMFDFQILDMLELGIDARTFKSMASFEGKRKAVVRAGSKPMFVFRGAEFETSEEHKAFKSLMLDFFRGEVIDKINLAGLDKVIVCTAAKGKIYFRNYGLLLKKGDTKFPRAELETVGPNLDFTIRRYKAAPSDLRKLAMQTPRGQRSSKRKNMEKGLFGDKMGRVHLGKQEFNEIAVAKLKGLKKQKTTEEQDKQMLNQDAQNQLPDVYSDDE